MTASFQLRACASALKAEAHRDGGVHLIRRPLIHMTHML